MVKSCLGERLKMSILVHILLNKEPSFVAGQSQQLLAGTGILRNPQEFSGIRSKYRNSCPTGIPAKISCKIGKKQEFLQPLQNHIPLKISSGKHRKKKQRFRHQRSLLCHASTVSTSLAALTFRPGGTSRG
jgi:hypothetical protein